MVSSQFKKNSVNSLPSLEIHFLVKVITVEKVKQRTKPKQNKTQKR